MPSRTPSDIDTDSSKYSTPLARSSTVVIPHPPATQGHIQDILQREQDRAMSLLSLSPLLSSLFITYASRVSTLESISAMPSPEGEEWGTLQNSIATLREENEKLRSENREIVLKLEVAETSQEAYRSQILSLKDAGAAQQGELVSLRKALQEVKGLYDEAIADSKAEKAAQKIRISDLEVQRVELKQTVAEQQVKISKLEHHLPEDVPPPVPARQVPPLGLQRASFTPSESIHVPHLRTPSPQGAEVISNSPSASISAREEDMTTHVPGRVEKARPHSVRGPPLPLVSKSSQRSHQKKSSNLGWLKALNDSF